MKPPPFRASIMAAGGVIHRENGDGKRKFLLVHRPRYDDWSLPKGKLNRREGFLEAALREVREETGIQGIRPVDVGSVGYETDAGNRKVVRWWHMEMVGGKFRPNREVDDIAWLTLNKATNRLEYTNDRKVLIRADTLTNDPSYSKIYLVRHARAVRRSQWNDKDRKRPLERRGRNQAIDLAVRLKAHPVSRILSSESQRCVQTAKPLVNAIRMPDVLDRRLRAGAGTDGVLELFRQLQGESAVVVTHGDVIGPVMEQLAKGGVDLDGPMEWKKGSVWVLKARQGRVRSGRYIPPRR
jgi:phosphohistidine phosphatase SixA/8-oxo-dGTP pyrophosphatase MutT (NUDIX family)